MQIIRIDETNFRAHMDKIALVFGLSEDHLSQLPLRAGASVMSSSTSKWGPERVLDAAVRCYQNTLGASEGAATIWLITGTLARALLGDLPGRAFTFMEGNHTVSVLTWFGDPEMLGRLFVHEWCHARRVVSQGLACQGAYVRYLEKPVHWLYEELLAIATEKRLFPHLSWEVAAGYPCNSRLRVWDEEGILSDAELTAAGPGGILRQGLDRYRSERTAFMYYLAYRLCKAVPGVTHRLEELMALSAERGLERLSGWMQLPP